jgi:1-acyl-sn-glycerol-3-phosphate acyltransferase
MREIVREGLALGVFVEGTRQRSGVPGEAQAGAAMVALQEDVPVIPVAVHGSQTWKLGNFHPVSIAWGEPMRFEGLPRGGRGYKQASAEIQAEIRRLWQWLVDVHALGRPDGVPPAR